MFSVCGRFNPKQSTWGDLNLQSLDLQSNTGQESHTHTPNNYSKVISNHSTIQLFIIAQSVHNFGRFF